MGDGTNDLWIGLWFRISEMEGSNKKIRRATVIIKNESEGIIIENF